jgi:hypothetical protein
MVNENWIQRGEEAMGFSTATNKEKLIDALREFEKELEAARRRGLPGPVADRTIAEFRAARWALQPASPATSEAITHLEAARDALTGISDGEAVADELLPFVQAALQAVITLFKL